MNENADRSRGARRESPGFITVSLPWESLSEMERGQLYEQARRLGELFEPRERLNVAGVFQNIATSALFIRAEAVPPGRISHAIPKDVTAPDSHLRDDLGTLMAFIKQLHDDQGSLPGVRAAWGRVLEDLRAERDSVVDEWRRED